VSAIRVVVVAPADARDAIVSALVAERDITVTGQTGTASEAAALVQHSRPHVMVVDLGLPFGAGLRAIAEVMAYAPLPILALTADGERAEAHAAATVAGGSAAPGRERVRVATPAEGLAAGAVEVLERPAPDDTLAAARLRRRVEILRGVSVIRRPLRAGAAAGARANHPAGRARPPGGPVAALAASTGGPLALGTVLGGLHGLKVPVLLVQHLHRDFVDGFVTFLRRSSALPVELARDQVRPEPGTVYVGPSDAHLRLGQDRRLRLDPEPDLLYRPSADQLFRSVAAVAGQDAICALLTGMGEDGAAGLLAVRQAGGTTIVQDEASSVVFGMPGAAQRLGAACQVLPLDRIARAILRVAASQVES
jgi:two-component system chemotaxis response regulator CheB